MKDPRYEEINSAINVFSECMAKRMLHKASEGFNGWQNPQNFNVKGRLLAKVAKIFATEKPEHKDIIDASNFLMMLFMADWRKTFPFTLGDPGCEVDKHYVVLYGQPGDNGEWKETTKAVGFFASEEEAEGHAGDDPYTEVVAITTK